MDEILITGTVHRKRQAGLCVSQNVKMLALLGIVLGVMLTITGCDKRERLYIYNWTYYTPDSVIEKFEKEFNVRVIIDEFPSNEDMYAKLKSGGAGYDIVFPSADYTSIMIHEKMLARIDKSLIPNLKNVDPLVLGFADYDTGMDFSVPYYFGAAGIVVNTARVPNYEKSWSIFAREDLQGRMTMLDDMREVIGDALIFLGYSANTKNPAELSQARDLIIHKWKPNLVKFDAESFGKGFATGDFWVVQGYPEVVFEEIVEDPKMMANAVFFIPDEGGPAYIDSMVILKDAKNIELAHKFINFIHDPKIYAEFCDAFGFPATANVPARQFIKGYRGEGRSWYTSEDLEKVELKKDLGQDLDLYNNAWFNSIRVGGE